MQRERLKNIAADLLSEITASPRPAEEILNAYTRTHKSLGSSDRRYLADLIYQVLRHFRRLSFCFPNTDLRQKTDLIENPLPDVSAAPAAVQWEVPDWLLPHIDHPEKELPPLLDKPNVILRANGNRAEIQKKLLNEGIETDITPLSPLGLILKKRVNLKGSRCYQEGLIEIQDEGSQLAALETGVSPGNTVLDYCAGAGGKSLIFAQMMRNRGKILAYDISVRSLNELKRRAERAKVCIIETAIRLPLESRWDFVIVDAPCSGTGTWRRFPDRRFKLTEIQFQALLKKQKKLLHSAAVYVKLHGRLVYITCSITNDENFKQISSFLKTHTAFKLCTHRQFSPYRTQTDGLFCAVMERAR